MESSRVNSWKWEIAWNCKGCLSITVRYCKRRSSITFLHQSSSINNQKEIQLICSSRRFQKSVSVICPQLQTSSSEELWPRIFKSPKDRIWMNISSKTLQKRSRKMHSIRYIGQIMILRRNQKRRWYRTSRNRNLASNIRWGQKMALNSSSLRAMTWTKFRQVMNYWVITRRLETLAFVFPLNWDEMSQWCTMVEVRGSNLWASATIYQTSSRVLR